MSDDLPHEACGPATADSTAASATRTLRIVALILLVEGTVSLVDLVSQWRARGTIPFSPGLLGPLAAWGLVRRKRAWWLVALAIVWSTLLGAAVLAVRAALGEPMSVTIPGVASEAPSPLTGFAVLAGVIAFSLWLHVLLTRPALLRLFRPKAATPWGPGMSMLLAGVAVAASQATAGVLAAWLADLPPSDLQDSSRLLANGTFLALTAAISAPLSVTLVWAGIWLRNGPGLREYLALRPVRGWALLAGLAATVVLTTVEHAGNVWLGRPIPEFVANASRSAASPLLLWLAFIVFAPISEEVVFRGFLFAGLAGSTGKAILVTAATFTSLHLGQYGAWDLGFLFAFGVLLGAARATSDSLYLPVAMHMSMNLAALLGTAAHGSP